MRRVSLVAILMLFLVGALLPAQDSYSVKAVSDGERLAMFTKPSVVRIIDGVAGQYVYQPPDTQGRVYDVSAVSLGSGFFIDSNGYIATNAHVVSTFHEGEDKARDQLFLRLVHSIARDLGRDPRSFSRENLQFIAQHSSLRAMRMFHHVIIPDGSAYEFEIKQYGAPVGEGKDVAVIKVEVKNAPVLVIGDSDKVQLQDHITVVGYPGAADTFNSGVLDSRSALEASITDGKISARKRSASGAPILQVSAPATHGNSGGPVLSDGSEVIGLLTFGGDRVNGQEVSGFAFAVPSSTVMEFVKAAGVTNQLGAADKAYREGLELYWQQRYSSAMPKFEEVKRLWPHHSEVNTLLQSSQQAITEGRDQSGISSWWIIGIVVAAIAFLLFIIILALAIFLIARKRRKKDATKPAATGTAAPSTSSSSNSDGKKPSPTYSPTPPHTVPASYSPSPSPPKASALDPRSPLATIAGDSALTVDLSQTIALTPDPDTAPISYGSIKFVSGSLAGQLFEIKTEGTCIGRDSSQADIVIADPRISKRHVWVGVRDGHVTVADQGSRNGTFVNDPKSPRVTERPINPGDTVILGESDVARFEYLK